MILLLLATLATLMSPGPARAVWLLDRVTNTPWVESSPDLDGSGRYLVYVGRDSTTPDQEIFLYDIQAGGAPRPITTNTRTDREPEIENDHIVWEGWDGEDYEIYLYDVTTGITTRLTDNMTPDTQSDVEGNHVVWVNRFGASDQTTEIWSYDIRTGSATKVTNNGRPDSNPAAAFERVVWQQKDATDWEIMQHDSVAGTTQLTDNSWDDIRPSISGPAVAWQGYDGSDYEIWVMERDRRPRQVTDNAVADTDPWVDSPGGRVDDYLIGWTQGRGHAAEICLATWDDLESTHDIRRLTSDAYEDGPVCGVGREGAVWVKLDEYGVLGAVYHGHIYGPTTKISEDMLLAEAAIGEGSDSPIAFVGAAAGMASTDVYLATAFEFIDVPADHPYHDPIYGMRQAGVIAGYDIGGGRWEFRPDNNLWRAQFAKMICGTMEVAVEESMTSPFTDLGPDVPDDLYPNDYVAAAYANGFTYGTSATRFSPYANITRAQIVTMLVRAVQRLHMGELDMPPAGYTGSLGMFDPTHGVMMQIAEYNGLLDGMQGFGPGWNPWAPANRGETAQLLWNAMGEMGTRP